MSLYLPLEYEQLLALIAQLDSVKRQRLLAYLLTKINEAADLDAQARKSLYLASIDHTPVQQAPSIRREDWYEDDGR